MFFWFYYLASADTSPAHEQHIRIRTYIYMFIYSYILTYHIYVDVLRTQFEHCSCLECTGSCFMILHLLTFLSEGVTDTSAAQDLSQIWECRKHRIGWKMHWLG